MHARPLVLTLAVLTSAGCPGLLAVKKPPKRFESKNYAAMVGKVGFAETRIPGSAAPASEPPTTFIETTHLTGPVYARGFLPEPYGNRIEQPCTKVDVPGWGEYGHADFASVRIGDAPEEILVHMEPVSPVYEDQIVEVDPSTSLFEPSQISFPFAARTTAYHFAVDVLPKLTPGTNRLTFTIGKKCMSDPRIALQVSSTLTIEVDAAQLATARDLVGPHVETAPQTNVAGEVPRITAQFTELFPDYEPVMIAPLDRSWNVEKLPNGIPLRRFFFSVVIAKHRKTGACAANQGVLTSEFDGNYGEGVLRLDTPVWVPFPCDNANRRVDYTPPDFRREP